MDAVVLLGVDVKVLVFLAKEAEVHIEAVDFRFGEFLLHLDGLLDRRDAADLAALGVARLEVAGAHAVDEAYLLHLPSIDTGVLSAIEPMLEVAIGNDLIIDTVAVLLLLFGIEKMEAGSNENGAADDGYTV